MTAEQTRKAALAKSLEAQAMAKRENALMDLVLWNAKADQLKKCVELAGSTLERVVYQKRLSEHLQTAIQEPTGDTQ